MEVQKSCGLILFDQNCKVLLLQGRHKHWWFPKGHREQWESCFETALRELKEETWLEPEDIEVRSNLNFSDEYIFTLDSKRILKFVDYFVGELKSGFEDKIKIDGKEIYAWQVLPIHEALKLLDFKNQRDILQRAYANFYKV